ncbi:MAG TPA: hypothetical protein VM680_05020, partial [Verrucomicrobiae bacterium]|nr:hypothetical protein [Verrucomicrobiae bacterium]
MNDDSNRSQLNSLKTELQRVELDLRLLRSKAEQLEFAINAQERSARAATLERLTPSAHVVPPLGGSESVVAPIAPIIEPTPPRRPATPPPLPKTVPPIITAAPEAIHFTTTPPPLPPPAPEPAPVAAAAERESFEMKLGTFWFVRIGIVMVLTAMVFLGNYAYQHYWGLMGPV